MASSTPGAPSSTDRMSDLRSAVGQARQEIAKDDAAAAGGAAAADDTTATGGGDTPPPDSGGGDGTPAPATKAEMADFIENATAEEIAAIKADPVLSKIYNSMLRDYRSKTEAVAKARKEAEDREAAVKVAETEQANARRLYDAIRDNPEAMIRALAERRGLTIAEATAAVEAADEELTQMFGEDAPAVKPLFDKAVEKRAKAVIDAALGPVNKFIQDQQIAAENARIATELESFAVELKKIGGEMNPDIEKEMMRLADLYEQGEQLSVKDYVWGLYRMATAGRTKAEATREVVDRMKRAIEGREPGDFPTGGSTPSSAALDPKLSFRESLAVARRESRAQLRGR